MEVILSFVRFMKVWPLSLLLFLIGCNSEMASLTSIQGIADPNNPVPEVIYIASSAPAIYTIGNDLDFSVTFSEPVEVFGLPELTLSFDSGIVSATYIEGAGTNTLMFRKTIVAGEYEIEGVSSNALNLSGGSIFSVMDFDTAKSNFNRFDFPGVQVNAATTEYVSSTPPADGWYKEADQLCFDLEYSAPVTIDSPAIYIPLSIGGSAYQANMTSGSGTKKLQFCYEIPAGMNASGISSGSSLMGGGLNDAFGTPIASLAIDSYTLPGIEIDTTAPGLSGITEPTIRTYYTGENVDFLLAFSERVVVSGGTPRISFTVGSDTKYAEYAGMYDDFTPIFRYTVVTGDPDAVQVSSPSAVIDFQGSVISDLAGNAFPVATTLAYDDLSGLKIDGTAPTMGTPFFISGATTFRRGDTINIAIPFSSLIHMTGTPYVELRIDGQIKIANLVTATPDSMLLFQYDVEPNLKDLSGVEVLSPIHLNGGSLKDGIELAAHNAPLTFTSFNKADLLVNTFAYITSASITTVSRSGGYEGSYKPTDTISINVNFSENVTITNNPQLKFDMDGTTKAFTASPGTGTAHVFSYTVQGSDFDMTGIQLATALSLDGSATIVDDTSTDVELDMPSSFLSSKQIYFIPSELGYWFDFDDPEYLSQVYSGGMYHVDSFRSKAETLGSDSYSGTDPVREDDGISYGLRFQDSLPFEFTALPVTMTNFIGVYQASATATSGRLFEFGSFFHQFEADYRVRTDCFGCSHFEDGAWHSSIFSLFYFLGNSYQWNSDKRIFSMKGLSGTDYLRLARSISNSTMYEILVFSSAPSDATLDKIYDYLAYKHQVNFNGPAVVSASGL